MTHAHYETPSRPVHRATGRNPWVHRTSSILIGDQLLDAIRKAPPDRLIGVRIATFAGYVTVSLAAAADDAPCARRERVFTRAALPESPFSAGTGLDEIIEQGVFGLCGAKVALVHRDGRHWLVIEA